MRRHREDTVHCVVQDMIDLESELAKELQQIANVDEDSDTDDCNDEDWEPAPVDLNIEDVSLSRRKKDIVRSLIDIYGSKDIFIKEYQLILADRLLNIRDYNIEKEVRGEEGSCDLMMVFMNYHR